MTLELLLYDSGMSPDDAKAKVAEILNVVGNASEPHMTNVRNWMREGKHSSEISELIKKENEKNETE